VSEQVDAQVFEQVESEESAEDEEASEVEGKLWVSRGNAGI